MYILVFASQILNVRKKQKKIIIKNKIKKYCNCLKNQNKQIKLKT